jgi:phospholipid/cholesterol/gamma-HCH transport system ATP-binding protein
MDIVIAAQNLSLGFDGRMIFENFNFQLHRGEICGILGGSGSGKSVFLKLLSGLFLPETGSVKIEGVNLSSAPQKKLQAIRAKMGFVFQDAALISNMSIYDNVALPLRYHEHLGEAEVQTRVAEKMALFEVNRKYDRFIPAQVSSGIRKRVALARALVLDPELLFLDEATSGLGAEADPLISRVLRIFRQKDQASLIFTASEWMAAFHLADRIGFLDDGKIAPEGSVAEMEDYWKGIQKKHSSSMET